MTDVGIVDYGAGNIASVEKAIDYAGGDPIRVSSPEAILTCDRLVLPGVGAAGEAINNLRKDGLDEALTEAVRQKGTPFLGICVGMQLLADRLFEFGEHKGLGWVDGDVVALGELGVSDLPVPQMGWNDVAFRPNAEEFARRIGRRKEFYFAHSFSMRVREEEKIAATVHYGQDLVAAVSFDSVFATQFHPEKSQVAGDILVQAFLDWTP